MPTYAELDDEVEWRAEYEPDALATFNARMRAHYGLSRVNCGSKGDNRHLRGRHRSRNWCLNSRYCTNRTYGTTDARDRRGDGDALRATDVGITGAQLREASRRLDAAVRAGRLPQLAEWFGTFDGVTVVGWYEGHASSSDSSHLYHLHLGYWTESTNNAAFFNTLYEVITGDEMEPGDVWNKVKWGTQSAGDRLTIASVGNSAKLDALLAAVKGDDDAAAIIAAVEAKMDAEMAELRQGLIAELKPVIVAALAEAGIEVDVDVVELALRRVLGGVDGATPDGQG